MVTIEDLKGNMCKWPSGDPKHDDFHFCGGKTLAPGAAYCEFHTQMAYREGAKPGDKKAPLRKKVA